MEELPHVNSICKFTFIEKFSLLNGVYKVVKKMTYDQARSENIDFYTYLYKLVGLTKEEYNKDLDSYKSDDVLQLVDVTNKTTIYTYLSCLNNVPDPTVKTYDYIIMGITLGFFKDSGDYEWIKAEVRELVKKKTGVDNDPKFFASAKDKKWMTDPEYDQLVKDRDKNKVSDDSVFTKLENLKNEITQLKTIIAEYERLLTIKEKETS